MKFNLKIGNNSSSETPSSSSSSSSVVESGAREEMSNADGKSYGWVPGAKMSDMIREKERWIKEVITDPICSRSNIDPKLCDHSQTWQLGRPAARGR